VFPLAVGSEEGFLEINVFAAGEGLKGRQSLGDSSAFERGDRKVAQRFRVPMRTLDSVLGDLALGSSLFVKLDIEGGELSALRGASRILESHRPLLLFELNPTMARAPGWTPDELFGLLETTADYHFCDLRRGRIVPVDPTNDIEPLTQGGDIDILAYCSSIAWHLERVGPHTVSNACAEGG
jgi:hypothetical protein